MLETTIIEVSEDERNKTIQEYQAFGWQVLNSQKVDYINSYTTGGGNAKTGYHFIVHNDRTNYYSITFQRDSKKINKKLLTLFDKHKSNKEEIEVSNNQIAAATRAKKFNLYSISGWVLISTVILMMIIMISTIGFDVMLLAVLAAGVPFLGAGIPLILKGKKKNRSYNQIIEQMLSNIHKLEDNNKKILKEAKAVYELVEEDDYIEDDIVEDEFIDDDDIIEV